MVENVLRVWQKRGAERGAAAEEDEQLLSGRRADDRQNRWGKDLEA